MQLREMHQTQVDIRQNEIMKFLTIVTTIFMPLTLIAGSVSYTHLDVYKRQVYNYVEENYSVDASLFEHYGSYFLASNNDAVSYTHLDVYKRQDLYRIGMAKSGISYQNRAKEKIENEK